MIPEATTGAEGLTLDDRRRIDAACDRFEAAWRASGPQDLAAYLDGEEGPARAALLRELQALDRFYRRGEGGNRTGADDPPGRSPESGDPDATAPATTLGGDGDLTRTSPGRRDPDGPWDEAGDDPSEVLRAAGYEVLGELGRGGMGVVYKANQAALRRTVAVKLIRSAGFASEAERRRFRNEAEAVAQLDHPNIVPIYEVGRHRGTDYFSMKLIEGAGLDRRLADFVADPRAAARLATVAAGAVDHAHRRGILHRDLKPANILVDGRGEPHITDFGLAKRVGEDATELTHSGAIVGTPSYMSPEQAGGGPGSVTVATDVYGLGSVLYALLTGRAPYAGSSLMETLDRVRKEPPEPPSRLRPGVPRDLEVICLKCLEKDPKRRYATAQALADDLGRWLAGEPIAARPVGPATRARMWCRRNPLPAALAGLLAIALVGGLAGVTWKWREADRERLTAEKVIELLADKLLGQAAPAAQARGKDVTVSELLDVASARLGGDLAGEPDAEARVREVIGRSYYSLGQPARAEPHLREAARLYARRLGPADRTTLRASTLLATLLGETGRAAEGESLARSTLAACRRRLGAEDPATLDAANALGVLLWKRQAFDEAEALLRLALDARRKVLPADHPDTLRSVRALGLLLQDRDRLPEADALAYEYEHGTRCSRGPNHPDNVPALANLGLLRRRQGKPAESEAFYARAEAEARRILGPDHPATLEAANDHARALRDAGRRPEAEHAFRAVLVDRERVEGRASRGANQTRIDLGTLLREDHRLAEAGPLLREAREVGGLSEGPEGAEALRASAQYALMQLEAGQVGEAAAILRRVVEAQGRILGPDHPATRQARADLARALKAGTDAQAGPR